MRLRILQFYDLNKNLNVNILRWQDKFKELVQIDLFIGFSQVKKKKYEMKTNEEKKGEHFQL